MIESQHNSDNPIPEFEPFRTLDVTSPEMLDDETRQIQIEARMQQIIAQPLADGPLAVKRSARVRRAVIAAATTLAVGLGGATAATAVGVDNPVGDWLYERLMFARTLTTTQIPEQTFTYTETAQDGVSNIVEYEMPLMECSTIVQVSAYRLPEWLMSSEPTMENIISIRELRDNPDFIRATQVLDEIDFAKLTAPLPKVARIATVPDGRSVRIVEYSPGAFDYVARKEFLSRLADEGWQIDQYLAIAPGNPSIGYDISISLVCQ